MNNIYKSIYNEIKKFKVIYIARHIGPDPDAFGSQMALKKSIKLTFPEKEVYAVGASVSRFKFIGVTIKSIFIVAQNTTTILNPQHKIPINDIR